MSFLDDGLAVLSSTGLDSALLNRAFTTSAGELLGQVGLRYAATGGHLRKGVFVWDGGRNKLVFQMNPEELRHVMAPVYAETPVPGQNLPMYSFINGGAHEVTFKLKFYYNERRREHVRDDIRTLQSLTRRPDVSGRGASSGPPIVYFFFGDYFEGSPFIVSKVEVHAFDLFDPALLLPMRADVDLTLWEVAPTQASSAPALGALDQFDERGALGSIF